SEQAQPTMMAIRMHEFGPPSVLKFEEAPRPIAGDGELLVRVHAASINPVDWRIRSSGGRMARLPYIPGFDISGVVEQAGNNVSKFKPGDEVFAMLALGRGGAYAEYAIVKES